LAEHQAKRTAKRQAEAAEAARIAAMPLRYREA
jgi:hypothetical protein